MYAAVLTLFAFLSPATFFVLYRHFQERYEKEARLMKILLFLTGLGNTLALGLFVYQGELYIGAAVIAGVTGLAAIILAIFTVTRDPLK